MANYVRTRFLTHILRDECNFYESVTMCVYIHYVAGAAGRREDGGPGAGADDVHEEVRRLVSWWHWEDRALLWFQWRRDCARAPLSCRHHSPRSQNNFTNLFRFENERCIRKTSKTKRDKFNLKMNS